MGGPRTPSGSRSQGAKPSVQLADAKHKALLVGITYSSWPKKERLVAPPKDAANMKALLMGKYGYREEDIVVMTDVEGGSPSSLWPTEENIIFQIKKLVEDAHPGDSFVFHYAGHSGQVKALVDLREEDGLDEYLLSCDGKQILDDDLRRYLVDTLPHGARLTAILDACHSGTLLDLNHYHCNGWILPRRRTYPDFRDARSASPDADGPRRRWSIGDSPLIIQGREYVRSRIAGVVNVALALIRLKLLVKRKASRSPPAFLSAMKCGVPYCRLSLAHGPTIISLSACADHQETWEDDKAGATMTAALVRILDQTPRIKIGRLGTKLRETLFDTSFKRHWTFKSLFKQYGGNMTEAMKKYLEERKMFVFDDPTPLVGSFNRLRLDEAFIVERRAFPRGGFRLWPPRGSPPSRIRGHG